MVLLDHCTKEWWKGPWPQEVSGHSVSIIKEKLYVFGGLSKFGPTNDLWCLDYSE